MATENEKNIHIPFNKPYLTGKELSYIAEAHIKGQLAGDGYFTKRCQQWLEALAPCSKALLTHSCTAALEMAGILCDLQAGDEVIMPSYTFVSTANAFVLRGARPVFIDIRPDTLNIDETKIEAAITPRTKAIVVVHYAGVACEMDVIMEIARRYGLYVVEDAAQACMATYKGRNLGTIGDLGCFSFHETKNIISGEGGALMVNRPELAQRAEIIREKGTDRTRYLRGEVDKYTWVDFGSSFLPGEVIAAFLFAQMEEAESINRRRKAIWDKYDALMDSAPGCIRKPVVPSACDHNAHMYYIICDDGVNRQKIINSLRASGIYSVFHYIPLHSSSFGTKYHRKAQALPVTDHVSNNIIRLPLWIGITPDQQEIVIDQLTSSASKASNIELQLQCA